MGISTCSSVTGGDSDLSEEKASSTSPPLEIIKRDSHPRKCFIKRRTDGGGGGGAGPGNPISGATSSDLMGYEAAAVASSS